MVMSTTVPIKIETLTAFGDEARRIGGLEDELYTDEMLDIFKTATKEVILPNAEDGAFGSVEQTSEPALTSCGNVNYTAAMTLGIRFTPVADVALYKISYDYGYSVQHEFALWDAQGQKLWEHSEKSVGQWSTGEIELQTPLILRAGETYTFALRRSGDYCYYKGNCTLATSKLSNLAFVQGTYNDGLICPTKTTSNLYSFNLYIGDAPSGSDADEYRIQRDTLDGIADEVKRIIGASEKLPLAQIKTALQGIEAMTT